MRRHMWAFLVLFLISPLIVMAIFGLSMGLATLLMPRLLVVGVLVGCGWWFASVN